MIPEAPGDVISLKPEVSPISRNKQSKLSDYFQVRELDMCIIPTPAPIPREKQTKLDEYTAPSTSTAYDVTVLHEDTGVEVPEDNSPQQSHTEPGVEISAVSEDTPSNDEDTPSSCNHYPVTQLELELEENDYDENYNDENDKT